MDKMSAPTPNYIPENLTETLSSKGYTLRIDQDDVKGRKVMLTGKPTSSTPSRSRIPAGTLLMKEKPVITFAQYDDPNLHCCAYCMQSSASLPEGEGQDSPLKRCSGCKCTYYCSISCQRNDFKETHKVECPILKNWAITKGAGGGARSVLKLFIHRLKNKDVDELMSNLDGCKSETNPFIFIS